MKIVSHKLCCCYVVVVVVMCLVILSAVTLQLSIIVLGLNVRVESQVWKEHVGVIITR